jgi:phosphatidylglycerophosphate synthase
LGKHKTISQITTIIAILVFVSYEQWGPIGRAIFGFHILGAPWVAGFKVLSLWLTMALTAVSGALYLWRNRGLYLRDM